MYNEISFDKILDGGSTHPWLIKVNIDSQLIPYAVKVYTDKHIQQANATSKEVYCSILANEFGLLRPKPALIEFTEEFINELPEKIKKELKNKNSRINFGCEFINGSFQYEGNVHRDYFSKYDIEAIYAFDNLVKNGDRRSNGKSNILFQGKIAYLIDHELTLEVNDYTIENFVKNDGWVYWSDRHIFHDFLKKGKDEDKKTYFNDFLPILEKIDFSILDSYNEQLTEYGQPTENYQVIKKYLECIQQNSSKFVKVLRTRLA